MDLVKTFASSICACGHARDAHVHYRPGSDCALCESDVCVAFRRPTQRDRGRHVVENPTPAPAARSGSTTTTPAGGLRAVGRQGVRA